MNAADLRDSAYTFVHEGFASPQLSVKEKATRDINRLKLVFADMTRWTFWSVFGDRKF